MGKGLYAEGIYVGLAQVEDAGYLDWPDSWDTAFIWVACFAEAKGQFLEWIQRHLWDMGLRVVRFSQIRLLNDKEVLAPSTTVEKLAYRAAHSRKIELGDLLASPEADEE